MFSGVKLSPIPASVCTVLQKPLDQVSLQHAGTWTGTLPFARRADSSTYLFRETPPGRQSLTLAHSYEAFRTGGGRELVAMSHPAEQASALVIVGPLR